MGDEDADTFPSDDDVDNVEEVVEIVGMSEFCGWSGGG